MSPHHPWASLRRRRLSQLLVVTLLLLTAAVVTAARSSATVTNVFSDGFESGNTWTAYTNGSDQDQSIVSSPVHTGTAALQLTADTDVNVSDVALAEIKSFSFTENQSQLSFWYYASGPAQFSNLTIETYLPDGTEYYKLLPGQVVLGAWTQVKVMFSQISSSLTGADIARFVIKAVAVPETGDASFTIDDVSIDDGVVPPANLVTTSPANGATSVPRSRVLTAFYDSALNPSTVTDSTVTVQDSAGTVVPAAVRYEVGQQAIAIIPSTALAADTSYHVVIDGVAAADGGGTEGDQSWSFTTGASTTGTEDVLSDELDSQAGWSLYSSAPTQGIGLVTSPVVSAPTALQVTGEDSSGAFVVSAIRQANWLDENSTLNFEYQVSGTASEQDVVVAATTAAGFTKSTTIAPAGSGWHDAALPIASIDPGLVGQVITQLEFKVEAASAGTIAFTLDDVDVTQSLDSYLTTVDSATTTSTPTPLDSSTITHIRALVNQIEAAQHPDGSIDVGPTAVGFGGTGPPYPDAKVDPYAANYAAMGLLRAYQVTGDSADLTDADNWLGWYQSHLASDDVPDDCEGVYPDCTDDGNQDAVDSYASTYLLASLLSYTVHPSSEQAGYLSATYPYVQAADVALDSVYQQDGLTWAKNSWTARYGMDNAETFNGLVAQSRWATLDGDSAQATLARYLAARTLYSLRNRFMVADTPAPHFANSVNADGTADTSFSKWYPDGLTTALVLSHLGEPTSADQAIYNNAVTTFDTDDPSGAPKLETDTPQFMWWAQAALRVGEPSEATHFLTEYYDVEGTSDPNTFAVTAGHLIRVLAYPYDGSLWF